jgi:hypothetical protein
VGVDTLTPQEKFTLVSRKTKQVRNRNELVIRVIVQYLLYVICMMSKVHNQDNKLLLIKKIIKNPKCIFGRFHFTVIKICSMNVQSNSNSKFYIGYIGHVFIICIGELLGLLGYHVVIGGCGEIVSISYSIYDLPSCLSIAFRV